MVLTQWQLSEIWWEDGGNKIKFTKQEKQIIFLVKSTGITFPTDVIQRQWLTDITPNEWLHISKTLYQFFN
jgi:hypothetical protein